MPFSPSAALSFRHRLGRWSTYLGYAAQEHADRSGGAVSEHETVAGEGQRLTLRLIAMIDYLSLESIGDLLGSDELIQAEERIRASIAQSADARPGEARELQHYRQFLTELKVIHLLVADYFDLDDSSVPPDRRAVEGRRRVAESATALSDDELEQRAAVPLRDAQFLQTLERWRDTLNTWRESHLEHLHQTESDPIEIATDSLLDSMNEVQDALQHLLEMLARLNTPAWEKLAHWQPAVQAEEMGNRVIQAIENSNQAIYYELLERQFEWIRKLWIHWFDLDMDTHPGAEPID